MAEKKLTASAKRVAVTDIFPTEDGNCVLNKTGPRDWVQSNIGAIKPEQNIELAEAASESYIAAGKKSGAIEVGGGTIPRFHLDRYDTNPYEQIRAVRKAVGPNVPLMALVRSDAGPAMTDLPADVVRDYVKRSVEAGIDVIRNFHSHNDVRQFKNAYEATKEAGGHFQAAYSYGVFDKDPTIFNPKAVVSFFKDMEAQGIHPDSYALKDPSGVLKPAMARLITKEMKKAMKRGELPNKAFGIHMHDQCGYGVASCLAAAEAGANFLDVSPSVGGFNAQPAGQSVQHVLEASNINTGTKGKPEARTSSEASFTKENEAALKIAKQYQTARYVEQAAKDMAAKAVVSVNDTTKQKLVPERVAQEVAAQAVIQFVDDVVGNRYRRDTTVEDHGIAGGQTALAYEELKHYGLLKRLPELKKVMEIVRADAGATVLVTPMADRVFRESVRIMNGGDPNKKFNAEYAKELTGEAGPVQGVINPAKQRQALRERTENVLKEMVTAAEFATLTQKGGAVDELVDRMREIAEPTLSADRLKVVDTRLKNLKDIVKEAKTDNDYVNYLAVLNEEIARSGMKTEKGINAKNVNDVIASLEAESKSLKTKIASVKDPVSREAYEAMQKGMMTDDLLARAMKDNPAFEGCKLTKEQMAALMDAATVTTVIASERQAPGLDKARKQLQQIYDEHKIAKPTSEQKWGEDVSVLAMFGEKLAMNMFKSRTKVSFRKENPTKEIPVFMAKFANPSTEPSTEVIQDRVRSSLQEAGFTGDTAVRVEPSKHFMKIMVAHSGNDHKKYADAVQKAVKSLGGEMLKPAAEAWREHLDKPPVRDPHDTWMNRKVGPGIQRS